MGATREQGLSGLRMRTAEPDSNAAYSETAGNLMENLWGISNAPVLQVRAWGTTSILKELAGVPAGGAGPAGSPS
jgi:hypothetical protein